LPSTTLASWTAPHCSVATDASEVLLVVSHIQMVEHAIHEFQLLQADENEDCEKSAVFMLFLLLLVGKGMYVVSTKFLHAS